MFFDIAVVLVGAVGYMFLCREISKHRKMIDGAYARILQIERNREVERDRLRHVGLLTSIANRLVKVLEDCKSNEAYPVIAELADFEAIAKDAREIIKRKEKYD